MRRLFSSKSSTAILTGMIAAAGCVVGPDDADTSDVGLTLCGASDAYSPYMASGAYPTGPVASYPWRGEFFENYGTLPNLVECASDKTRRPHLDVTAGCLDAVLLSDRYRRGRIDATGDGAFRAIALGDDPDHPVKWTDQAIEYRFWYAAPSGSGNVPGFKAFTRYRTEDDLYVGGWRTDGVAMIQKKQCGKYTVLALDDHAGAPSRNAWHRIRFEAHGDDLELWLDGARALTATSNTFSWGTAGLRVDSMDGAYLDDWRVE